MRCQELPAEAKEFDVNGVNFELLCDVHIDVIVAKFVFCKDQVLFEDLFIP